MDARRRPPQAARRVRSRTRSINILYRPQGDVTPDSQAMEGRRTSRLNIGTRRVVARMATIKLYAAPKMAIEDEEVFNGAELNTSGTVSAKRYGEVPRVLRGKRAWAADTFIVLCGRAVCMGKEYASTRNVYKEQGSATEVMPVKRCQHHRW